MSGVPHTPELSDPDVASVTPASDGAGVAEVGDVPAAFDRAAATYDRMVNLNPGYHRHLQSAADALVEKLPSGAGLTVVDLGCGSGASTDALVNSMGHRGHAYRAVGVDGSGGMLEQARSKPWPTWVSFSQARAEELSTVIGPNGRSRPVAGVLAAYLFRNVDDRDAVLRSVWDLLMPGGVLVVQDYSVAGSPHARTRWNVVSWSVVIPLSKVINRDTGLYRYLWRSVLDNDAVSQFAARMLAAGFVDVEHRTAGGWQKGILHTYRGRKPA